MTSARNLIAVFLMVEAGCLSTPALRAAVSNPKVRQAVEDGNNGFMSAVSRSDGAAVAALYSEGAQLLPPNHDVVSGRPAIQSFWNGVFDSGVKQAKLETIELEGEVSWAYEVGRYRLLDASGAEVDRGKYVVVWVREKGTWRLHRDIWNTSRSTSQP